MEVLEGRPGAARRDTARRETAGADAGPPRNDAVALAVVGNVVHVHSVKGTAHALEVRRHGGLNSASACGSKSIGVNCGGRRHVVDVGAECLKSAGAVEQDGGPLRPFLTMVTDLGKQIGARASIMTRSDGAGRTACPGERAASGPSGRCARYRTSTAPQCWSSVGLHKLILGIPYRQNRGQIVCTVQSLNSSYSAFRPLYMFGGYRIGARAAARLGPLLGGNRAP